MAYEIDIFSMEVFSNRVYLSFRTVANLNPGVG